jgi:hypothetical protein
MHPSIWGPQFWYIMHVVSFEYPENPSEYDKRAYYMFYQSIGDILPCDDCKKHYKHFFNIFPIQTHLDSRSNLIKWVVQIHNFVNEQTNKQVLTLSEVLSIYKTLSPQSPFKRVDMQSLLEDRKFKKSYRLSGLIIVMIIIILFLKWYHNKYYFF